MLAVSSVRIASNALEDEVQRRVLSSAELSGVAVHGELAGLAGLVESYAKRQRLVEALQAADRRKIASHLRELKTARPGIATTFIARMDGRLVEIVPATEPIVGDDFSFRDWYKGVTRTRRTYVSEANESQARGRPLVVAVTTLIREPSVGERSRRPIGILVAAYGLGEVQRLADSFAGSQGVELTVTDRRGTLLASPGSRADGLVSRRGDPVIAAALRGSRGVTTRKRAGRDELVAYEPVRGLGWAVAASVPKRSALAPVGRLRSAVYGAAGLLELALLAGLLVLVRNMRGRRRAEEAAERNRLDALQARQEAERARDEAERANHAKSEFLSRMSHELRTPLNSVLGFAQLLELGELRPDDRESVGQIMKAGNHLLELINEVLDIARIEAGRLSLSLEPVSVQETALQLLELVGPIAADRRIRLSANSVHEDVFVCADRQRLKQVLLNLLSNAVKYNREGGSVTVGIEDTDDRVRIVVADTGDGIAPEQLDRLFIPFDRLNAEGSSIEGTGLGLALAKGLAEAMGGQLGAESAVGEGSRFWIELDRALSQLSELRFADDEALPTLAGATQLKGTVLYIEDNLTNVKLVDRILGRFPDIELVVAMQGGLGLDLAGMHRPDLILLDLHLPNIGGEEVLAGLRADPRTAGVPVVILSADATPGRVDRLHAQGITDYLTKPLDLQRFVAVLNAHLGPAGSVNYHETVNQASTPIGR